MLFRFGPEDLHELRILIVEDEYLLAADLAEAMRARGAEVIGPVGTLAEAMKAVETNWIDRAVLDLDLGGEMSFAVADRLEAAAIPYVIASGCSADVAARTLPRQAPPGKAVPAGGADQADGAAALARHLGDPLRRDREQAQRVAGGDDQRMAGPDRQEDVDLGRQRVHPVGERQRRRLLAGGGLGRGEVEAGVGEAALGDDAAVGRRSST